MDNSPFTRSLAALAVALVGGMAGCNWLNSEESAEQSPGGSTAASFQQDDVHPEVLISTTLGDVRVRLDAEHAPLTVENFLGYVERGHYDGTIFHQVAKDFVAIAGGYRPDLLEKPAGLPIRNEADHSLANAQGTIAMARQAEVIDSATSQFFFNLANNAALDHRGRTPEEYGYCVFGQVVDGGGVVEQLGRTEVRDTAGFPQVPVTPVAIKSVRRIR